MYISYRKSHYHSGTADLRHMWLVLVRLTPAFLSTPWLAGGWPATDAQLGWLFLPHGSSSLASRPAGASSHDSSGRAPKSNKRKPLSVGTFQVFSCGTVAIGQLPKASHWWNLGLCVWELPKGMDTKKPIHSCNKLPCVQWWKGEDECQGSSFYST